MSEDARFEDGGDKPLNLGAFDGDDLQVVSSLAQDAVLPATEMRWDRAARRLSLLINRVRWEDAVDGGAKRPVERVRALLVVEHVMAVASQGVDRNDADMVLSVLSVSFEPDGETEGFVVVTLAGDGAIRARVEVLEVRLRDVTRPYTAPSKRLPRHPD